MEKRVWKGKILPGKLEEYEKRHKQIWPEMSDALKAQGIHNYTIWNYGEEVIGYYECESLDYADTVKEKLEVCRRWAEDMQEIMILEKEPETNEPRKYRQIFSYH